MSYVVTEHCIGCSDRSCVSVCPAECFYWAPLAVRLRGVGVAFAGADDLSSGTGMLMIHPDECISCGACETECPVEGIYDESSVPEELSCWPALNAGYTRSLSGSRKARFRQFPG